MMRKLITIILAALIVLTMMPMFPAYAAGDETNRNGSDHDMIRQAAIDELAAQLQDKNRDPFGYTEKRPSAKKSRVSYPEKFDLRNIDTDSDGIPDTSYVTPVKLQNPFGSCWGFAAIAAAETSILSNPELNNNGSGEPLYSTSVKQGEDGKEILDLSEKHLVYFAATAIDDPSDPQNGEGMHFLSEVNASDKMNNGGLPFFATSLFSSGIGPNLTNRPYSIDSGLPGDMSGILAYHGKNSEVEKRKVNGKWQNFSYSIDDDWAIDNEYRYYQSYMLKQSYLLPTPAGSNAANEYEYNPYGTEAIKEMLVNGRAVQIAFYADTSDPNQDTNEGEMLNYNTWAQYADERISPNHAVTVIGWDDDFDKNDFVNGKIPPKNGAWLVKNSWGSGEEPFPNYGTGSWGMLNDKGEHTGYFWLSYYDQTIRMPEALEFDRSNVDKKYYLDQYDLMPAQTALSGTTATPLSTANVFTADQAQQLEQISCQTSIPGTHVTYEVYLLGKHFNDPKDGVKLATEEATYDYGGFHKLTLSEPVMLQKGQNYAIVVTQVSPQGEYAYSMQCSIGKLYSQYMGAKYWLNGVINEDESFVCIDGEWSDLSNEKLQREFAGEEYELLSFDNFPIKGYSTPVTADNVLTIIGDEILSMLPSDNSCVLKLRIRGGSGAFEADPEIIWSVPESSRDIIEVTPDDDSGSCDEATVTAKNYGTGYVMVTVPGIGSTVVRMLVWKHELNSGDVTIKPETFTYTGEACTPEITVACPHGCPGLTAGTDYEITYANNIDAGEGSVTITGIGDHQGTITVPFTINKANGSLNAKAKTVKLKASSLKKKAASVERKKAMTISKPTGKVTYKMISGPKKVTVNKKTGKLTVKKGTKKATYRVKIKVTSAESKNYLAASKTITVKIVVK